MTRNIEVPAKLVEYAIALIARGKVEGAYRNIVASEAFADRTMDALQGLWDDALLAELNEGVVRGS